MEMKDKNRFLYLDILRIIAIFLVLFTHTYEMGNKLYEVCETTNSFRYWIYLSLDCLRTINVPLFFMISGALLLGKEETVKEYFLHRVLRFLIIIVFFSYLQNLYCSWNGQMDFLTLKSFLKLIYHAEYRGTYWFLGAYFSFLLILPLLRLVAVQIQTWHIVVLLVLGVFYQDIAELIACYTTWGTPFVQFPMVEDCILFPILGYYFHNKEENLRAISGYLISLLVCIGVAAWLSYVDYCLTGSYSEFNIVRFKIISTIATFCIVKIWIGEHPLRNKTLNKGIRSMSQSCFGIYLLENILERFSWWSIELLNRLSFVPMLVACIGYLLITMIEGTIVITLLRKIPIIKRLL